MLHKVSAIKFLSILATTAITCLFALPAAANPVIPIPTQPQVTISPSVPNLNASGFILIDANSGKVLAEKNADARLAPASLTKLMTMYVISDAIKNNSIHMDDKVRISTKAWKTGG